MYRLYIIDVHNININGYEIPYTLKSMAYESNNLGDIENFICTHQGIHCEVIFVDYEIRLEKE